MKFEKKNVLELMFQHFLMMMIWSKNLLHIDTPECPSPPIRIDNVTLLECLYIVVVQSLKKIHDESFSRPNISRKQALSSNNFGLSSFTFASKKIIERCDNSDEKQLAKTGLVLKKWYQSSRQWKRTVVRLC